ncbi:hypothetical protein ACPUGR_22170, partial [Klebsiella aerogenes]
HGTVCVVGKMRDLILQLSKSSIYSTKPPKQIKALGESLGKDKIIGQAAHLNTDLVDDHTQDMWNILSLLVESDDDIQDLKRYFSEIQELLKLFFVELHNKTINA